MSLNLSDITKYKFLDYLKSLGLSEKSHKNYKSDLAHFTSWLILKLKSFGSYAESLTEAIPFLSPNISKEYKEYMRENNSPIKTINRRLSTLRHLSRFLFTSSVLDSDFMKGIENISLNKKKKVPAEDIAEDFRSYLESEKVSKNTAKNYTSDIRQFLHWIDSVSLNN